MLGVQLALVSHDRDVHFNASQLGIQVFESVRQAQESHWRRPARLDRKEKILQTVSDRPAVRSLERPKREITPPSTLSRLGLFSLGVLALLSIAAVLLPSADVHLSPQIQSQDVTLQIKASESFQRINLSGQIPIHTVNVTVEGQDSIETSGRINIPDQTASGSAVFSNLTDHSVVIPAGLVITTQDGSVRFATRRGGNVSSGPGRTLDLPIEALQPGSHSNLAAGKIQAIEGPLGVELTVTNPQPTTGGSDLTSPAASPLDQSRLRNRLETALRQSALQEIQSGLDPGDILLTELPIQTQILEMIYDPDEAQPANNLTLKLRLEYQAPIVRESDLSTLATAILDANLPDGYSPIPGSLDINHLSSPERSDDATYQWRMKAERKTEAQVMDEQATQLTIGLSPLQASQRLVEALPLAKPPTILMSPSWWPRMPFLPFRISIVSEP